nr:MAG TPA: hypothetical protein [Caudoviricetes sp.]
MYAWCLPHVRTRVLGEGGDPPPVSLSPSAGFCRSGSEPLEKYEIRT